LLVSIDGNDKKEHVVLNIMSKWSNRAWDGFSRADLTTILQRTGGLSNNELENIADSIESFVSFVMGTPDALNSNCYYWTDQLHMEIRRARSR
jgi:hypothetical protein